MHELSLLQSVIDTADSCINGKLKSVNKITLQYSENSRINKECLLFAWSEIIKNTIYENAELAISIKETVRTCNSCNKKQSVSNNTPYCEDCASSDIKRVGTDDLMIKSIEGTN
jgi:hydrogenase nickel incorporation protein HypA/HybF